ncbi:MAG: tetratricopeptide repeat protein [Terriglobia bacterium]
MFNRIVLSLVVIVAASALCDFYWRPSQSSAYRAAVSDYSSRAYRKSLDELAAAGAFEPNDPAVLSLMGWDLLRLRKPRRAEQCFRRAHWLEPYESDPLLGDIYAEISLENYARARRLIEEFDRRYGESAGLRQAADVLDRQIKPARRLGPARGH